MYLVSNGSYSDYSVMAVFTTLEGAEKFRHFHNYDEVEDVDLDPVVLDCVGDSYRCEYSFDAEKLYISRTSNNNVQVNDWIATCPYGSPHNPYSIECTLVVNNEGEARKMAQAKVDSFLSGESIAKSRYVRRSATIKDGMPSITDNIYECFDTTFVMVEGKVELQSEEKVND